MIRLCIFDMGGVMIRNFHIFPALARYLELPADSFAAVDVRLSDLLKLHSAGMINEEMLWKEYETIMNRKLPEHQGSLLGKFFDPTLDLPTVSVVDELKAAGIRVVCGTNVIDAHYKIHQEKHQYDMFDAVYPSHLMHLCKPNPEFYEKILKAEQVPPHEAFFTDDAEENVRAAKELGIVSHLYTNATSLRKTLVAEGCLV